MIVIVYVYMWYRNGPLVKDCACVVGFVGSGSMSITWNGTPLREMSFSPRSISTPTLIAITRLKFVFHGMRIINIIILYALNPFIIWMI